MERLAGELLKPETQPAAGGRRIRLLDGTTVAKAGENTRRNSGLWRLHRAFDLPAERFSFVELTDEKGGERLDRTPFAKGDIAIADRGFPFRHHQAAARRCPRTEARPRQEWRK